MQGIIAKVVTFKHLVLQSLLVLELDPITDLGVLTPTDLHLGPVSDPLRQNRQQFSFFLRLYQEKIRQDVTVFLEASGIVIFLLTSMGACFPIKDAIIGERPS